MIAVRLEDDFGIDNLRVRELPDPEPPGRGRVRLRMQAASINYRDYLMVVGRYNPRQPLPLVPLSDGTGRVVEVGEGVTRVQVGDRVNPTFGQGWTAGTATAQTRYQTLGGPLDGTLQTDILVEADSVVPVAEHLTDEEAATLPCAGVTAWNAVVEQGGVQPGQVVVVQGTGGVALFALAFARMAGAHVIVLSKSNEKLERARGLGAAAGINYVDDPAWGRTIKKQTGGADLVVELGGAETLEQSVRAVRPSGRICMIGVLSGNEAPVNVPLVVMQNLRLQGVMVGSRAVHEAMMQAIGEQGYRPVVDRVYPLQETADAFHYLKSARHFGKICIRLPE